MNRRRITDNIYYLYKILIIVISLILYPMFAYPLSEIDHEKFLKRDDYKAADWLLNRAWKDLKHNSPKDIFKIIIESQRYWVKEKRDIEADILKTVYPYSDDCTRYFLITLARAMYLDYITKYIKENQYASDGDILRYFNQLDQTGFIMEIVENIDISKTNPYNKGKTFKLELNDNKNKRIQSNINRDDINKLLQDAQDNLRSIRK